MTVKLVWDGLCKWRDRRTGEWKDVRIIIRRNFLHVISTDLSAIDEENLKLKAILHLNLKSYNLRVQNWKDKYFCLSLIAGFKLHSFGFDKVEQLKV